MSAEQLSFWGDTPAVDEPADEVEVLDWCPGTIEQDGQTLYYVGGLTEGRPRYAPRPDLDALVGVPYDLATKGWRTHPYKPTWLFLDQPPAPGIVCAHDLLADAIAAARKCEAVWADMAAAEAAYKAKMAEQVKQPKRKRRAA